MGADSDITRIVTEKPAALAYISTHDCSVCTVLRPKVSEMIETRFPRMEFVYIPLDEYPGAGDFFQVTAVPTVIGYFAGREHVRKVRVFGLEELAEALSRPYSLLFDE